MLADVLFLWVVSVPLSYLVGIVFGFPSFFVLVALKIDEVIKGLWCASRLFSKKWMTEVEAKTESTMLETALTQS